MADSREEQLARIDQLERIREKEARLEAQMAEPDKEFGDYALGALQAGVKGLDYLGAIPRALVGGISGKTTGEEIKKGLSPLTLDTVPDMEQVYERSGMPEGAAISDYVPGFENPVESNRWYVPDKGGMLDLNGRDLLGAVSDELMNPLNYASLAGAGALKRVGRYATQRLAEKNTAKRMLLQTIPDKVGKVTGSPAMAADWAARKAGEMIPDSTRPTLEKMAKGVDMAARFPSKMVRGAGNIAYKHGLKPMVDAAEAKGKDAVETYYRNGIWGPNILDQVKKRMRVLKDLRDAQLQKADSAGATLNRGDVFTPMIAKINDMTAKKRLDPEQASRLIDSLVGTKASGAAPNLSTATQWKTDYRRGIPDSFWSEFRAKAPGLADEIKGSLATSIDRVTKKEMASKVSKEAAEEFGKANWDLGVLLDTRKAAFKHQKNASPFFNPMDALYLTGEAYHPGLGAGTLAVKKAGDVLSSTPVSTAIGYGLKRAADGDVTAPLIDAVARNRLTSKVKKSKREDEENK